MKLLYLVESGKSKFLVFDEMPDKISTKYGDDTIIGRIGGIFYDFLAKRNERREAFGGRKFDIVLDNGEIEKCEGQWWDAATDRARWIGFSVALTMKTSMYVSRYLSINHNKKSRK